MPETLQNLSVGIDVGTSAVKVIAIADDGSVVERREVPYPLSTPKPGWSEQDPDDWWAATEQALEGLTDGVAGIGPKTRQALLRQLGGMARIRAATDDELLAVPGVTARHVKALRAHFAAAAPADADGATATPLDESGDALLDTASPDAEGDTEEGEEDDAVEDEGSDISDPALAAALRAAASPGAERPDVANPDDGDDAADRRGAPDTA